MHPGPWIKHPAANNCTQRAGTLTPGTYPMNHRVREVVLRLLCSLNPRSIVMSAANQLCSALMSVVVLHRRLTLKHVVALVLVTAALVLRALPQGALVALVKGVWLTTDSNSEGSTCPSASGFAFDWRLAVVAAFQGSAGLGLACMFGSAVMYSVVGALYEHTMAVFGADVSHAEIAFKGSVVGFVVASAFQAAYTWPRREALVRRGPVGALWGPGVALMR